MQAVNKFGELLAKVRLCRMLWSEPLFVGFPWQGRPWKTTDLASEDSTRRIEDHSRRHNHVSHVASLRQVFITPFGVLRFMDRLGDPTLKTLTKAVDTMRASMLSVIQVVTWDAAPTLP